MNTQNTQVEDIRKATEDIMKERISQTAKREKAVEDRIDKQRYSFVVLC